MGVIEERAGPAQQAESPADAPVIDVRGLRMRYGPTDVLAGVDFTAVRGEVLALLGPNGAGKTTTIEILEGFRNRSAGEVRVLGVDPARAAEPWRARVGIVLQSWRDHGKWRVRELLRHLGRYYAPYSTSQRPRPRDVGELIESVGLGERRSKDREPVRRGAAPSGSRHRHHRPSRRALPQRNPPPGSTRWPAEGSTTCCTAWPTSRTPRSC